MAGITELIAGTTTQLVLLGVLVTAATLLVLAAAGIFLGWDPVLRRLRAIGTAGETRSTEAASLQFKQGGFFDGLLRPFARAAQTNRPVDDERVSIMRRRLVQAGYRSPGAVQVYYVFRVLLAITLPIVVLILLPFTNIRMGPQGFIFTIAIMAAVGYFTPTVWIGYRAQTRKRLIEYGFPDALDMLLVCVEAGLGLAAALDRVSREIGRAHPALGDELQQVSLELRAGQSRQNALRRLAERVGLDEVNALVTILIQAETLGTSIAQALRVHAADMRAHRLLRAEEEANKLPVKMAIPLILLVLPALIIAIMLPAIIRIVHVLFPTLSGGA